MLSETLAALLAISLAMSAIGGVVTLSAVTSASEDVLRAQQETQGNLAGLLKQAVAISDPPPNAMRQERPRLMLGDDVRFHCNRNATCVLSARATRRGVEIRLMEGVAVRASATAPPGSVLMAYAAANGGDEIGYIVGGVGAYDQKNVRPSAFVRATTQLDPACRYDPTSYACIPMPSDSAP